MIDQTSGQEIQRVYPGNSINSINFSPTEPNALVSTKIHWVEDRGLELNSSSDCTSAVSSIEDCIARYGDPRIHDTGGQIVEVNLENGELIRSYGDLKNSIYSGHYDQLGKNALLNFEMWNIRQFTSYRTIEPAPIRDIKMNLEPFNIRWGDHGWTTLQLPEVGTNALPTKVVFDAIIHDKVALLLSYYVITEFPEIGPENYIDDFGITRLTIPQSTVIDADIRVSLMSLEDGDELQVYTDFKSAPTSIDLSPDQSFVLIGLSSPENSILLMDAESGELIRRFVGHTGSINDVAFSPDGLTVLSASDDRTLILWDVSTGQIIRQFNGHNESVTHVVFSKDGQSALSTDGTEIIDWRVETLEDILARVTKTRDIRPLNCIQREQYNVQPLCEENPGVTLQPDPTIVPTSFLRVEVLFSSANVRAAPQSTATIVTSLNQGDIVDILEITPDWYKIAWGDGQEGWISRQLVKRK